MRKLKITESLITQYTVKRILTTIIMEVGKSSHTIILKDKIKLIKNSIVKFPGFEFCLDF